MSVCVGVGCCVGWGWDVVSVCLGWDAVCVRGDVVCVWGEVVCVWGEVVCDQNLNSKYTYGS